MPILGLTDRGAQLPRLGTLRKGAPKPNERQPGRDLNDHFRFECDDGAALAAFTTRYGDKPNNIRVMLSYPTVAENFETWQEHHSAGALKHRCDGKTAHLWLDPDTGRYRHDPIPCPSIALLRDNPQIDKKHLCRPVGRLKVVLPELQRMAYVLVPTTSLHDIMELQANLEAVEALRGDLRGIPFILSRRVRKVSTPSGENGQRSRREKWLLSMEPAPDWVRLQLTAMQHAALPVAGDVPLLPAGVDPATGEMFDDTDADCADLRAVLKRVRQDLQAAGGAPWQLTQRQVLAMTCAELQAEIDATMQLLQTLHEAASAGGDADPDDVAEWDAIEADEVAAK